MAFLVAVVVAVVVVVVGLSLQRCRAWRKRKF